ncbi:uncharacterized protein LOC125664865 [Ostrea edulis]|uniref:uncharacterized protein LOC125664865 n=1 Tax=Ostrea edulis TaxID=37623 RepID=UPI0024AEA7FE|nr:uncharacterized protein LOC125664865 [Ostrea edulis]
MLSLICIICIASFTYADVGESSYLLSKYKRDPRLQSSPFHELFIHWRKYTKIIDSVQKETKALQRQIKELRLTTNSALKVLTNGLGTTKAKLSNLEGKYSSLDRKVVTEVGKVQTADRTTRGKVTTMSQTMTRMVRTQKSLENEINNNKCQSGVVKSAYFTRVNMVSDRTVRFARPFQSTPKIVFGLSLYDSSHKTNDRLNTYLLRLDRNGFTLRISAWAGTLLFQAHYFWMACP